MQGDLSYPHCATAIQLPEAPSCIHLSVYPFCPSLCCWGSGRVAVRRKGRSCWPTVDARKLKRRRSTCCFRTLQPPHVSTSLGSPALAASRPLLFLCASSTFDFASSIRCSVFARHGWPWPWPRSCLFSHSTDLLNSQGVCHRLLDRVGA